MVSAWSASAAIPMAAAGATISPAAMEEDFLTVADGTRLRVRRVAPAMPRAIVQISHGMAEHSGRYRRFAEALCGARRSGVSAP